MGDRLNKIETVPEFELSSYEPVEFSMPEITVSDEQVEAKVQQFAEQHGSEYEPTKRKVVGPKDNVSLDIEITKDGEVLEDMSSKERIYTIGEGLMPIDFDRGILGMNVGEERSFQFKAPDYSDLDNIEERMFDAKVKILSVMEKKTPVINDEWVKKYMPVYKSADEFREQMRKQLIAESERTVEQERNSRAATALAERFDSKIDDEFYEDTRADLIATYEQQAKSQGMDLEDFLGKQGIDEQQFSMMLMFQARSMLTQGFSLDAWARHYNIEATDKDIAELVEMMAPGHGPELLERMKDDEDQMDGLKLAARRYVANKDLTSKAKITYNAE